MSIHKDKNRKNPYYVKFHKKTYRGFLTKSDAAKFENELIANENTIKRNEMIAMELKRIEPIEKPIINAEDIKISKIINEPIEEKPTKEDITISQLAEEYLKYQKENFTYGTYMKVQTFLERIVLPNVEDKSIYEFNERDCMKFRSFVQSLNYSTQYKNNCISSFKALFNYARKFYQLVNNPTVVMDKIKPSLEEEIAQVNKQTNVWTYEEFNKFIVCVPEYKYQVFFYTLFYTGMRLGECLALTWNDVKGNKINILKSLTRKTESGIYEIKAPKTRKSIRTITISDNLKKVLEDYKAKEMEVAGFSENWYVFARLKPLPQTSIDRIKDNAIKESGVKRVRIHDLRHSYATNLINSGASIVAVSKSLGHSTITQTLDTYTHLLQKTDENMVKLLGSMQDDFDPFLK